MRSWLDRLLALVKRELNAEAVELIESGEPAGGDNPAPEGEARSDRGLFAKLTDGRTLVVHFTEPPTDPAALTRRLGVIVASFEQTLAGDGEPQAPRSGGIAGSLHDELRALATRARAINAVVIDAHSPVTWGSALDTDPLQKAPRTTDVAQALQEVQKHRLALVGREPRIPAPPAPADPAPDSVRADEVPPASGSTDRRQALTDAALDAIRALPGLELMRRGRPLREQTAQEDLGWVTHSFASIYLATLVFEGPFDELRAQRALHEALPRIEQLVLALPPFDPEPQPVGAVISMRSRRRS